MRDNSHTFFKITSDTIDKYRIFPMIIAINHGDAGSRKRNGYVAET